jgi:hypothetical protein
MLLVMLEYINDARSHERKMDAICFGGTTNSTLNKHKEVIEFFLNKSFQFCTHAFVTAFRDTWCMTLCALLLLDAVLAGYVKIHFSLLGNFCIVMAGKKNLSKLH